jgi:plasmid stabilization system protein ParE
MVLHARSSTAFGQTSVSYTVRWNQQSLDALADIWLANAEHRAEINEATASIDQLLANDPSRQGESRENNRRILVMLPLVVMFTVNEMDREVRVSNVRHVKRRDGG